MDVEEHQSKNTRIEGHSLLNLDTFMLCMQAAVVIPFHVVQLVAFEYAQVAQEIKYVLSFARPHSLAGMPSDIRASR
jgi:hypothetical protein